MRVLYSIAISIYGFAAGIAALFNNQKAVQWTTGRKDWKQKLKAALSGSNGKRIWIHCASLGEFEQGRPLIEKIKSENPSFFIVLSFFSPSGYEPRKNFQSADYVCYLPTDNRRNAEQFISMIAPLYVVFVKYEYWLNYFEELKRKQIPLYMVSAIFRESQVFFKWYGSFYRKMLNCVNHFFVQDTVSARILNDAGFNNVSVSGDTRFDRVAAVAMEKKRIDRIENFRQQCRIFIGGSTWQEDEELIFPMIASMKSNEIKLIIAPHEVSEKRISEIERRARVYFKPNEVIRFSSVADAASARVLIIDNIGILSSAYGYGNLAWIGGGFGKGIHNILESAAFGVPVIFGPRYEKFREASDLIDCGGAFSVKDAKEAEVKITQLLTNESMREESASACLEYVNKNTGATSRISAALQSVQTMAEFK